MRKHLVTLIAGVLVGCSGLPNGSATSNPAQVTFVRSAEARAANREGGIFELNGHPVPATQRFEVSVSAGRYRIGYLCPGWMYVDGYPVLKYRFQAGGRYRILCVEGNVRVEPAGA